MGSSKIQSPRTLACTLYSIHHAGLHDLATLIIGSYMEQTDAPRTCFVRCSKTVHPKAPQVNRMLHQSPPPVHPTRARAGQGLQGEFCRHRSLIRPSVLSFFFFFFFPLSRLKAGTARLQTDPSTRRVAALAESGRPSPWPPASRWFGRAGGPEGERTTRKLQHLAATILYRDLYPWLRRRGDEYHAHFP